MRKFTVSIILAILAIEYSVASMPTFGEYLTRAARKQGNYFRPHSKLVAPQSSFISGRWKYNQDPVYQPTKQPPVAPEASNSLGERFGQVSTSQNGPYFAPHPKLQAPQSSFLKPQITFGRMFDDDFVN